jgi:tetratricopeptide (TPR) repeat protein
LSPQRPPQVEAASPTYDQIIDRALSAFEAQRYLEARELFEQAHALQPSARTLRGQGVTAVALHDYDRGLPELEAALDDSRRPLTPAQRQEVEQLVAWIRTTLPTVRLTLAPEHAAATLDEQVVGPGEHRLDPGSHALAVSAEGYETHNRRFVLEPAERAALHIDLTPARAAASLQPSASTVASGNPSSPPEPARSESAALYERTWFWVAVGSVVAGAAVTTWLLAQPGPQGEHGDALIKIR